MSSDRWNVPEFENVARLMRIRTGISLRPDQKRGTELGIRRAMKRSRVEDLTQFVELVHHDSQAWSDLVSELTVGETYFFREPRQFDFIRDRILPEIRERRGVDHKIRIWCSACASGEEAYSLAILCRLAKLEDCTQVMATDISDEALSQARQARYREWSLRGDGAALARGFLQAQDDRLVLHRAIVESVEFDHLNLAEDVYPSVRTGTIGLDLITCRNVLIYFDRKTVSEVARRLYDSLAPGGWLIAASGDPSLSELAAFESVITDDGIYYRRPLVESSKVRRDQTFVPLSSTIGQNSQDSQAHSNSLVEEFLHRDQSVNDADDGESELPQTSFEEALESGRYEDVIKATSENLDDAATCVAHVRALAKIDPESAVHRCGDLLVRHPLSHELQYVHSLLLLDLRQDEEAAEAAQRAVYLNPGSAPAHFLLGAIEQKRGFVDAARRHFRNTRNICSLRDGDEVLDLTGSGTAAELSAAATARLKVLDPLS